MFTGYHASNDALPANHDETIGKIIVNQKAPPRETRECAEQHRHG